MTGDVDNCPDRDHEEVLCPVKEERVVVGEGCRVRARIADLHLVELFRVCHIRDIEQGKFDPARRYTAPLVGRRFLADADDVRRIIRVQVIGVTGDLQFPEDLRASGVERSITKNGSIRLKVTM